MKEKFRVGDKVKVIETGTAPVETKGLIGIIKQIDYVEKPPIQVYFEGINDYWYYYPSEIQKQKADEMFEELGYKVDYENSYTTVFFKNDNLFGKKIEFFEQYKTFNKLGDITMPELQAINEKCKELGWI